MYERVITVSIFIFAEVTIGYVIPFRTLFKTERLCPHAKLTCAMEINHPNGIIADFCCSSYKYKIPMTLLPVQNSMVLLLYLSYNCTIVRGIPDKVLVQILRTVSQHQDFAAPQAISTLCHTRFTMSQTSFIFHKEITAGSGIASHQILFLCWNSVSNIPHQNVSSWHL